MKVLDLECPAQHVFEGWFGSEADFQDQLQRQLVQCPLCADTRITKRLSAPRLNLGARDPAPPAATPAEAAGPTSDRQRALQAAWLRWARTQVARADDVGDRFAEEARRMHAGEQDERPIRGRTSPQEALALLEEGVPVLPLPPSVVPETPLQ